MRADRTKEPHARIIIADDHPIVRRGLRNIVDAEDGFEVVAEAGTADEVLDSAARVECDIVVLDLAMPGAAGFDVLKELRRQFPRVPVLVLSVAPEDPFALRALKAGASGYLTKRSAPDQLVDAIRRVVSGGVHLSLATGRALVDEALRPVERHGPTWSRLSNRELEVLRLLASGMSPTRIGRDLGISIKTVSTHRKRLLTKLGLETTADLVRYALAQRLIDE